VSYWMRYQAKQTEMAYMSSENFIGIAFKQELKGQREDHKR